MIWFGFGGFAGNMGLEVFGFLGFFGLLFDLFLDFCVCTRFDCLQF